jgi:opacity protein-like surface antigen
MKKFILMLTAVFAMASSLSAQNLLDGKLYVAGFGGANFIPSRSISSHESGETVAHTKLRSSTGYFAGAAVGYKLCNVRLETEFSYRHNRPHVKHHATDSALSDSIKFRFDLETYALLVNAYYDFDFSNCWNLKPYVGAGIGYGHNQFRGRVKGKSQKHKDDKFAWQLIAGVAYPVTDCVDLAVEYRYFDSDVSRIHNHDAGVALRYWF